MSDTKIFEASPEAKGKAKQLRLFALLAWILAMAGQVFAILKLISDETLVWLIVAIVVILILAITGSTLWKKANKLDPASEKEPTRFFIQNQLGAIMGVLAFLPLVILILTNKNISGKTKGIAGSIAGIAMVAAGISGVDFNPSSIEKYTEEINQQTEAAKSLNIDSDNVYWSKAGNKYHAFDDCHYIKGKNLSSGSIKESWEQKGISELCKICAKKAANSSVPSDVKVLEGNE
ncbi:MAG: hypothetical protein KJN84_14920 [Bacteroidia bacterium]|nr:hypothetical protein [Bacteroidia bacterium]